MHIDSKMEGGNIQVLSIENNQVNLAVELRDTTTDWFYWGFRVVGGAGRTVTFTFKDGKRVGYYGAAVSHDQVNWQWTNSASEDYTSFTYTFGPNENEVFFNHNMRYSTVQFMTLCSELGLEIKTIAVSERGRPIPYVEFGDGEQTMLFTSRHHACESTGTYLMEGVIRTLVGHVPEGYKVIAIPFVDMDGVVDGDQGKNRGPHDQNRDYIDEPLYACVRAIKKLADDQNVITAIDLHSPWHFGGRHDVVHIVRKDIMTPQQIEFGKLLMARNQQHPAALRYDTANDLPWGEEWNTGTMSISFSSWYALQPGVKLALSLETAYFGEKDNVVSQPKLIELGACVAEAACDYLKA